MKFTPLVFKYARSPQNVDKVPPREISRLSLKNRVSGSSKDNMDNKCLYEMSLLFKCWADNKFNDQQCAQETQALNQCYKNYVSFASNQRELKKIDIPTPNAKSFTNKQITHILRMYPTV
ncbi:small ribosomal subunit protein mS37 isoform X2 [Xylocopa sonorina]